MPKEKTTATIPKQKCVDELRHCEYYDMQPTFDELYARSQRRETFTDLMSVILSRENILLAYRNIKTNTGSQTAGTDGLTIRDIGRLSADEVVNTVRYIIAHDGRGYRPKPVKRKDIPKPYDPTKSRPLGIPCIWDRLIQQCIKQVMEPICEAQFSKNSYGFRPQRSVEHAIAAVERLIQISHLHYVIEFDLKGFFDNVNHSKLIRQIWAMGIRDKHLIWIIQQILKAPVRMPDGEIITPEKGTPQGGILSPLLANIVLNELDHWIESQWQENPVGGKYKSYVTKDGHVNKGNGYKMMRETTHLKEMFLVRYADDFRILCRTKCDAEKTMQAVKLWLGKRLKLEVSEEKTRVVNVKRRYSNFLGFKIRVHQKSGKQVIESHVSDKQLAQKAKALVEQARRIASPRPEKGEAGEIRLFNAMVMGLQNYYCIATAISCDFSKLYRRIMTVLTNRLRTQRGSRLVKSGRKLTPIEQRRYGKSKALRFVAGTGEPIYPIAYIRQRAPLSKKNSICCYTKQGRTEIHDDLRIDIGLLLRLMRSTNADRSIEYSDNRISLFCAQWGKCAVTGKPFLTTDEIHCHHKKPRKSGGTDQYGNLILVCKPVHKLIHAVEEETIQRYQSMLSLSKAQMEKVNKLRITAGLKAITTQ